MPAISVIVPVYQAEALLPQCVESVLAQTFSDWELLLIDDLGTEPMLENITVEYLFTLLNERRSGRLPTLIATNLTPRELQARYTERIFSRMVDRSDTELLHFIGQDVRLTRH